MSITSVTYYGDASTRSFSVPFPYLLASHVKVYVNDTARALVNNYTWSNSGTILFNTAPPTGMKVTIRRETQQTPMVDFSSKNRWRSEELDLALKQAIYLSEEAMGAADGWHTGPFPPASDVGDPGDLFLDTTKGDIYEKTENGIWVLKSNVMGPQGPVGPVGPQGPAGPKGPVGATIRILGVLNHTDELPATAGEGDAYLINRDLWVWVDYQFVDAGQIQAPPGDKGDKGDKGDTGVAGPAGSRWYSGAGAPNTALGATGDWYINQTNEDIYEKGNPPVWNLRFNIKGDAGAKGDTGPAGPAGAAGRDGMRWYSGDGAPGGALGVAGDFYINKLTFDTYQKVSTTWTFMGNIKGAAGTQGQRGDPGPVGPIGPMGPSGSGSGDMVAARYDANDDGKVDSAETADTVQWVGVMNKPSSYPPETHTHIISDVTDLHQAIDAKAALIHTHTIADVDGLQTAIDAKVDKTYVDNADSYLSGRIDGKVSKAGDTMSGNLEIGMPGNPTLALHSHGVVIWNMSAGGDGSFNLQNNSNAWGMHRSSDGGMYFPGNVVAYWSDARLKEKVEDLDGYEVRIMGLRPVSFQWNEKGRKFTNKAEGEREIGFIAQETQKVCDQFVVENKTSPEDDGVAYLTVQKDQMIADLVAMVQELNKRIAKLEGK